MPAPELSWFKLPVVVVVATQLLFTAGDLLARANMKHQGFTASAFLTRWFLLYFVLRQLAMFGQLYVFSSVDLGRTMALFGASSIVLSNLLGLLLLSEVLSLGGYLGVALAVAAFIVLALR
jgi:multidrug transporter EmrE-like cation transporter